MSDVIYTMGDLHGRYDLLVAAQKLIRSDAKKNNYTEPKVVYLGDYVDRGAQSAEILNHFRQNPLEGFTEVHLKGNHEEMMYKAIGHSTRTTGGRSSMRSWRDMWLMNGGIATLISYGLSPGLRGWESSHQVLSNPAIWDWDQIRKTIGDQTIHWIMNLPSFHVDGSWFFAHAGLDPMADIFHQNQESLLWIRDKCHRHPYMWKDKVGNEYRLVHGHTPTRSGEVEYSNNRINMDVGAVWNNRICVIALENGIGREIWTPRFERPLPKGNR